MSRVKLGILRILTWFHLFGVPTFIPQYVNADAGPNLPRPTGRVTLFSFERGHLRNVANNVDTEVVLTMPPRYFEAYLFECNATYPVQWAYIGEGAPIVTADVGRTFRDFYDVGSYTYQSILLMYSLNELQSGRYICRGASKEHDKLTIHYDVFVPGNGTQVLLSTAEKKLFIPETKEHAYIPCGVSDSTASVDLYRGNQWGTFYPVPVNGSITFNPRKGFKVRFKDFLDPWGTYLCVVTSNKKRRKVHLIPESVKAKYDLINHIDGKINVYFSYEYEYNRVLCCTGTNFLPKLQWAGCGSILDCQVKSACFEENRCEQRLGNSGYNPSKWIDPGPLPPGCSGYRLRDDPNGDFGLFKCSTPGIAQYQPYLLNRGNIFLDFEKTPPSEMILTLQRISPEGPSFMGDELEFHCNSTRFYFAVGIRWGWEKLGGEIEFIDDAKVIRDKYSVKGHRRRTTFKLPHSDIKSIICFVPVVNSATEWRTVSLPIVMASHETNFITHNPNPTPNVIDLDSLTYNTDYDTPKPTPAHPQLQKIIPNQQQHHYQQNTQRQHNPHLQHHPQTTPYPHHLQHNTIHQPPQQLHQTISHAQPQQHLHQNLNQQPQQQLQKIVPHLQHQQQHHQQNPHPQQQYHQQSLTQPKDHYPQTTPHQQLRPQSSPQIQHPRIQSHQHNSQGVPHAQKDLQVYHTAKAPYQTYHHHPVSNSVEQPDNPNYYSYSHDASSHSATHGNVNRNSLHNQQQTPQAQFNGHLPQQARNVGVYSPALQSQASTPSPSVVSISRQKSHRGVGIAGTSAPVLKQESHFRPHDRDYSTHHYDSFEPKPSSSSSSNAKTRLNHHIHHDHTSHTKSSHRALSPASVSSTRKPSVSTRQHYHDENTHTRSNKHKDYHNYDDEEFGVDMRLSLPFQPASTPPKNRHVHGNNYSESTRDTHSRANSRSHDTNRLSSRRPSSNSDSSRHNNRNQHEKDYTVDDSYSQHVRLSLPANVISPPSGRSRGRSHQPNSGHERGRSNGGSNYRTITEEYYDTDESHPHEPVKARVKPHDSYHSDHRSDRQHLKQTTRRPTSHPTDLPDDISIEPELRVSSKLHSRRPYTEALHSRPTSQTYIYDDHDHAKESGRSTGSSSRHHHSPTRHYQHNKHQSDNQEKHKSSQRQRSRDYSRGLKFSPESETGVDANELTAQTARPAFFFSPDREPNSNEYISADMELKRLKPYRTSSRPAAVKEKNNSSDILHSVSISISSRVSHAYDDEPEGADHDDLSAKADNVAYETEEYDVYSPQHTNYESSAATTQKKKKVPIQFFQVKPTDVSSFQPAKSVDEDDDEIG